MLSSFAIILKKEIELVALLLLPYGCIVTVNVLWLFLTVVWIGLKCVIIVNPDHTHLLLESMIDSTWPIMLICCNDKLEVSTFLL